MIRVCIYHYDMGVFQRKYIQSITASELARLENSEFRRVLVLTEDDWYGQNAPSVYPE